MPVYNSAEYLERALDSFANQTYKNLELLCINDASTDNSLEILERYQKADSRIHIINFRENKGQGYARNIALKKASGDYIMFLDSDDTLELDACELAINQIVKNNNDFVFFNFKKIYSDGDVVISNILKPLLEEENNPHINPMASEINMFHCLYIVGGIYNKNFILDNNIEFNTSKLCEDDIFYTKCWLYAKDVSVINKPLYNYFKRGDSSSYNTNNFESILIAKKECYEECKKHYKDSKLMFNYVAYYIRILLEYHKDYSKLNRKIEKDFFYGIKKAFQELDKNENLESIKYEINNTIYNRIKNHSYFYFKLCQIVEKILAIRKYRETLVVRILGKTYKIPRNKH